MVKVFFHRCLLGACSARLLKVRSLVGCADPLNGQSLGGESTGRIMEFLKAPMIEDARERR